MVQIGIQGACGRMGRVLAGLIAAREDCAVRAGIDVAESGPTLPFPIFATVREMLQAGTKPDVLIDFSNPAATVEALEACAGAGLPIVVCTTGLDEAGQKQIFLAAERTAVFHSANMSLGINLLAKLVKQAQAVLAGFDIEIVEKHHRNKLDAPSGTALMLADAANQAAGGRYEYVYDRHAVRQKRGDNELGISAVRGGSIVGEHEVIFAGHDEVVSLSHVAYSREVFAQGAIAAALFLPKKRPGLYNMDDVLEIM